MKNTLLKQGLFIVLACLLGPSCGSTNSNSEPDYIVYEVNPTEVQIDFFWKDKKDQPYGSFENLKNELDQTGKDLLFAMNGGMYRANQSPQGLYIEKGITLNEIDTQEEGYGNFYMQPNGLFYLAENNTPYITTSRSFIPNKNIKYATQSGPMLLIDGKIHPKFKKGSSHLNIRNGVGILANGNILFAMSTQEVNFYDFAQFFSKKGCKNALYLDGYCCS